MVACDAALCAPPAIMVWRSGADSACRQEYHCGPEDRFSRQRAADGSEREKEACVACGKQHWLFRLAHGLRPGAGHRLSGYRKSRGWAQCLRRCVIPDARMPSGADERRRP